MQLADEHECRYIFPAVGNLGELLLEVADVGLETVTLPHFDGEEVVVVLLGLSVGGILSEERLNYLHEVAKRMWRQGVEPIQGHAFQVGRKG